MSNKLGKDFGFLLEEMGLITETELVQALASQYQLKPLFDFAKRTFLPEVLRVVTAEVALENMLFPLQIAGGKLALAIADPTRSNIADNISANNGLSVVCFLSTKNEIKTAICRHYFGKDRVEPTEKTVLIVEDNKAILAAMKEILSKHYRVVTATDGLDAYKEVISTKPHVVLTDMEMPKLSGFGLLYALRAVPETRLIPIILISGTTSATAEAQAFQKGFFDFIPKPVKETTLLTRVQRAYEFSQQQNQLFLN
jgi:CheY-like chemotaxis protein